MGTSEAVGSATSLHEAADPRILRQPGTAEGLCPYRRSGVLCLKEGEVLGKRPVEIVEEDYTCP